MISFDLKKNIDEIIIPLGFKKKLNSWSFETEDLIKKINLQKSKYSNSFYINYGFILKSIPLDNLSMHVFNGLGSENEVENSKIKELLDLENNIINQERITYLKVVITKYLLNNIQTINSEIDLLNFLKKRKNLNDIPLIVKRHFKLIED